jgi:hypothetical protein
LGNHLASARNLLEGKRIVGFIDIPPKKRSDSEEGYRFCARWLYQRFWAIVLNQLNQWIGGINLVLPGTKSMTTVHFRVGALLADIPEFRMLAGTASDRSVRCHKSFPTFTRQAATGSSEVVTAATASDSPGPVADSEARAHHREPATVDEVHAAAGSVLEDEPEDILAQGFCADTVEAIKGGDPVYSREAVDAAASRLEEVKPESTLGRDS